MALHYENLDERTRQFMLKELEADVACGSLYVSSRLSEQGLRDYPALLRKAIEDHDDEWLANELRLSGCMKTFEQRRTRSGGFTTAAVPVTAADTLAEGEFNRFYTRGLCLRALDDDIPEVEVYRGKAVREPRPESVHMMGRRIPAAALLEDLRHSPGIEPALGLPPGPNSGLTVRLP